MILISAMLLVFIAWLVGAIYIGKQSYRLMKKMDSIFKL